METPTYIRVAGVVYKKAFIDDVNLARAIEAVYGLVHEALYGAADGVAAAHNFTTLEKSIAQTGKAELIAELDGIIGDFTKAQTRLEKFFRAVAHK